MKRLLTSAAAAGFLVCEAASAALVNEIHYDNVGTDTGEFLGGALAPGELIGDFQVVLYNGSGGATYGSLLGPGAFTLTSAAQNGWTIFSTPGLAANSIQNGSPDGLALVNTALGQVVQFLSYEGGFAPTNGPAAGLTSTDIGIAQDFPVPPAGSSLGLVGTGDEYSDFTSAAFADDSPGLVNVGQTFLTPAAVPEPSSFLLLSLIGGAGAVARRVRKSRAAVA